MFNLDLKYKKDFLSVEMEDQEEEQLVDSIGPLVCKEDLFSHSQLVELVNNLTQDPVLCSAKDADTEKTAASQLSLDRGC